MKSIERALDQLRVHMEVPINEREASERGLPQSIGKLIVCSRDDPVVDRTGVIAAFSDFLLRIPNEGETLIASPYVPFLSQKRMNQFLEHNDLTEKTIKLDMQTYLIPCMSSSTLINILRNFSSEAIIFLTHSEMQVAKETFERADQYRGKYAGYEIPFMERLDTHGGFVFFAETHCSLEALGTRQFIFERCLSRLLSH